jgi:hypothetical protein
MEGFALSSMLFWRIGLPPKDIADETKKSLPAAVDQYRFYCDDKGGG